MYRSIFNVATAAFTNGNYAKAKFLFDRALEPLTSAPPSEQDSAAWINYANTCQMLGYYAEAERVYSSCSKLGFHKELVQNELDKMARRKSNRQIPAVMCNNEKIRSIICAILPCFPSISKSILAFVAKDQTEIDDFFLNRAGFGKTYILSDYSSIACGFYDNPEKYVLVFSDNFFNVFKTDAEMIGNCAHELAHFALASGVNIKELVGNFDTEMRNKVTSAIGDKKYTTSDSAHIANNEYVTDAVVAGCGFAYELSAAWRAMRAHYNGLLSEKLMTPEELDTFWHAI